MVIRKKGVFAIFFISVLLFMPLVFASDVAYIYRKEFRIEDKVVSSFEDLGLSVDFIDEDDLRRTDFSGYRFLFVGDERFTKANDIPVSDYPTIISNNRHGGIWGLTDGDGISTLAGSSPLEVKKNGQIIQVYTQAFFRQGSTSAIPYYYLSFLNKDPDFETVAEAYNGGIMMGDVISYFDSGNGLSNGDSANGNICFYGVVEADFWTPGAENLFEECIDFVASACSEDSDCGDLVVGEDYCSGNDVVRDETGQFCENGGSLDSACVGDTNTVIVESCDFGCFEGSCIEVECVEDSDCESGYFCNDSNECEFIEIHDVGFNLELSNNVNGIRLEEVDGTDILGDVLLCNEDYKIVVEVENLGTVIEDITFSGSVDDVLFEHNPKDDLAPGVSSLKTKTVNFALESGIYGIIVEAFIDEDENLLNNVVTRQIEIECGELECVEDSDCGTSSFELVCEGDEVVEITTSPSCSESNECSQITNEIIVDSCDFGCFEGSCLDEPVECNVNSECGETNVELSCVGDSLFEITTSPWCTNENVCSQVVNQVIIETCDFGCGEGSCLDEVPECVVDEDCDEGEFCNESNECEDINGECSEDSDCGGPMGSVICDGNTLTNRVIVPICSETNSCEVVTNDIVIEECAFECTVNGCVEDERECIDDVDCGEVNIQLLCVNDDVYEITRSPMCTLDNQCSNDVTQNLIESCDFGCEYGSCNEVVETNSQLLCVNDELHEVTRTRVCNNENCEIIVEQELIRSCEDSCILGQCVNAV